MTRKSSKGRFNMNLLKINAFANVILYFITLSVFNGVFTQQITAENGTMTFAIGNFEF